MILAICLGVLSGIVGFIPLFVGLRLTRHTARGGTAASMLTLILALVVSFLLLFVFVFAFFNFDRDNGFVFLLCEVLALSITAVVFAILQMVRK